MIEFHFQHWEVQVFYLRYSKSHYKRCKVFILGECSFYLHSHVFLSYPLGFIKSVFAHDFDLYTELYILLLFPSL